MSLIARLSAASVVLVWSGPIFSGLVGAAAQCPPPRLEKVGSVSGGGQPVSLLRSNCTQPDSCPLLLLGRCEFRGRSAPRTDLRCLGDNNTKPWDSVSWYRPPIGSGRYRPVGNNASTVNSTTVLAGWYRALCCVSEQRCSCHWNGSRTGCEKPLWISGLNMSTWDVGLWPVQLHGKPRLSVKITQHDPTAPPEYYLPKLYVELIGVDSDNNYKNRQNVEVDEDRAARVEFAGDNGTGLSPGKYKIRVRPTISFTEGCRGSSTYPCPPALVGKDEIFSWSPEGTPPKLPAGPGTFVYVVVGVVVGVLVAGLLVGAGVCLARRRTGALLAFRPLAAGPESLPLAESGVTVLLLLHRTAATTNTDLILRQLEETLRTGGVTVLDLRCSPLLGLVHTYTSPAELLQQPLLRSARLLFIAVGSDRSCSTTAAAELGSDASGTGQNGGGGGGGDRGLSMAAQMYDSILRYVRNGHLGADYGRVFVARLADGSVDGELAGLPGGRLFTLPDDVQLLLEHLKAPPAG